MNRKTAWLFTASICLAACMSLATGCKERAARPEADQSKADESQGSQLVMTTFYPTAYFARRIAGELLEVANPCPFDADPAEWMPDDEQIEAYQNAGLIIINGASFEKWVDKVSLPESRVVDTTEPLADRFITFEHTVTHSHGEEGEHSHEGIDGHTWLDPASAKVQATMIRDAFIQKYPRHAEQFQQGFSELKKDLDGLDARLKGLAPKMAERTLLCSHPAYNYLGRSYGWKLKTHLLDPYQVPSDEELAKVKADVEAGARYMLWEEEPDEEVAADLTALGLENIVFSPCESLDPEFAEEGEDYLSIMNRNVDRLEAAFSD